MTAAAFHLPMASRISTILGSYSSWSDRCNADRPPADCVVGPRASDPPSCVPSGMEGMRQAGGPGSAWESSVVSSGVELERLIWDCQPSLSSGNSLSLCCWPSGGANLEVFDRSRRRPMLDCCGPRTGRKRTFRASLGGGPGIAGSWVASCDGPGAVACPDGRRGESTIRSRFTPTSSGARGSAFEGVPGPR